MKLFYSIAFLSLLLLFTQTETATSQDLIIYSGRSKALVDPLINEFQNETGIRVRVRYGGSTQLAVALLEEGSRSPADLFWAQDAGALGAVTAGDMLEKLPSELSDNLPEQYKSANETWVATSGRARVLAYSTRNVSENDLPETITGLTDDKYRNKVGWAPSNGSFQSFLTGFRLIKGDEATRQWLDAMRENGAKNYANNNALIQAIAAGEIDYAITNHYYLYRYTENNPDYPVRQTFFEPGDPGNLINVSGAGILKTSNNKATAEKFIAFLLSDKAQNFFTSEIYEYPVTEVSSELPGGFTFDKILKINPKVDLDQLSDLEKTLRMLREARLL